MTDDVHHLTEACNQILAEIRRLTANHRIPIAVALDGRSGAGKSTLAGMIEKTTDAVVIPVDDFFAADIPDAGWDARSVEERARDVFDWRRLRVEALEPLLAGRPARWHAFDFEAGARPDGTYSMRADTVEREPAAVILLDGAYTAGPQLADLADLMVLVEVPPDERHARLLAREKEEFLDQWHARWDAVEEYYFTRVRPRTSYDLVVTTSRRSAPRDRRTS